MNLKQNLTITAAAAMAMISTVMYNSDGRFINWDANSTIETGTPNSNNFFEHHYADKIIPYEFRNIVLKDMAAQGYFTEINGEYKANEKFYTINPEELFNDVNKAAMNRLEYNRQIYDALHVTENLFTNNLINVNPEISGVSSTLEEAINYVNLDYLMTGHSSETFIKNLNDGIGVCHTYATYVVEAWKVLKGLHPELENTEVGYVLDNMNIQLLPATLNIHTSVFLEHQGEKTYFDPTVTDNISLQYNKINLDHGHVTFEKNDQGDVIKSEQRHFTGKYEIRTWKDRNIESVTIYESNTLEKILEQRIFDNKTGAETYIYERNDEGVSETIKHKTGAETYRYEGNDGNIIKLIRDETGVETYKYERNDRYIIKSIRDETGADIYTYVYERNNGTIVKSLKDKIGNSIFVETKKRRFT